MKMLSRSLLIAVTLFFGCEPMPDYDAREPARGPGALVGNDEPITDGVFAGGGDAVPEARSVEPPPDSTPPTCDEACRTYCEDLGLENPVNRGLCSSLWGVGLAPRPIDRTEACRRLFVDMLGRLPSHRDIERTCHEEPWGDVVSELMATDEFVDLQRRRYADVFLYNTQVVSLERIYDMDRLVEKTVRGHVPYDLFAQVASAHPVVTRRYADPGDIANAVYELLLGRPAFDHERTELGRLYAVWVPGYYDHRPLNMRLPDAFVDYECMASDDASDPDNRGRCTSTLFGDHSVSLQPDWRAASADFADGEVMWSGMLTPEEWHAVQLPGRILTETPQFWEKAVDDVLEHYLGYDLSAHVPEVREELIRYFRDYQGDIRSLHYAVATSVAYLQSSEGDTASDHRWTFGPRKQIDAQAWLDSLHSFTGVEMSSRCDHRLTRPNDLVEAGSVTAYQVLQDSGWGLNEGGRPDMKYAELARTLGGCPENESGGRFRIVSVLTTSSQLNHVAALCDPDGATEAEAEAEPAPHERLLPDGVDPGAHVSEALSQEIFGFQSRAFLGRDPTAEELTGAEESALACGDCSAEQFARSSCFAILSSAEMLFY